MSRRSTASFTTITTTGGLLPGELLARLAQDPDSVSGTRPEDYHLPPGSRLRDAINRSWTQLLGAWESFEAERQKPNAVAHAVRITRERWLMPLFDELGFGRLQRPASGLRVGDRDYPVSHLWGSVPIHLLGFDTALGRRTPGKPGAAGAAPHSMLQELLNRTDDHLWAILSNGLSLRLLRDNTSLTRPAYVEFDLEAMFEGQVFADFVVLWMLCHQSRFEGERPSACRIEAWTAEAHAQGVRALDSLREGFRAAITELGTGFLVHPANRALRERLSDGSLTPADYYRQLLRVVYRLVFLLVAEDRDLLHPPGADDRAVDTYARYFSVSRLRELARSHRGSRHADLWESCKPVFRALHRDGLPELALPVLGSFLWAPDTCPDLEASRLSNSRLLAAVRALAYTRRDDARHRVDFANLGPEELGSIYESLLELHPRLEGDRRFELVDAAGNERKTTGSYYTPTSLIAQLLDTACDPVLDEAEAQPDPEAALLSLKVLDPACGSGHFLVAAAQRIAARLAAIRSGESAPTPEAVHHALRDVIGRCIYGIDVNPMAVELCKVNLWLEAVEPGRPLSYLDHHIVCGNALLGTTPDLVGAGVPGDAFVALTGDDKTVAASWKKTNKAELTKRSARLAGLGHRLAELVTDLAAGAAAITSLPDDTPDAVEAKARAHDALLASEAHHRARLAADAWCAAFLAPKRAGDPPITTSTVDALAEGEVLDEAVLDAVIATREQFSLLHPHVTFPEVFAGGGFDLVIGNPPWEKVKLSEKEFFAPRIPEVAAAAGAKRKALIKKLEAEDPALWEEFQAALRRAGGESHYLRKSGRFPLCGVGDVNTYAVFAELMRDAVGPAGRVGVIVPTGIATDDTTKRFFADCVDRRSLASLFDFENGAPLFPGVHRSFKFCLLTLSGRDRPIPAAEFAFFARRTTDLGDPERRFELTPEDLALMNPNTRTAPVFRTRRDAELTKKIYRNVPVLVREGDPDGNPWGVEFSTMFHMTNDSHRFRTAAELAAEGAELVGNVWVKGAQRWLPLYEAKMVHHFNHRFGDYAMQPPGSKATSLPDVPADRLADPCYVVQPRYWVAEHEVRTALGGREPTWLLGFRDITNVTNERTMIASAVPPVPCGHKLPVIHAPGRTRAALLAVLDSFSQDFVARQKVGGTNMTFFVLKQLPVPAPDALDAETPWDRDGTVAAWMAPRTLELTYTAWDLQAIAADLGHDGPPFRWDPERRELIRAELDAAFFHLYGLDRDDVDYVMDTFPIVRRTDEQKYGEYRTKRLILERYDAIAEAMASGNPYETPLDPPPGDPSCCHPESTRPDWARSG
ncbi:MAG: hypothetical protein KatS3mg009_1216 [Acidimicrobiia bacterium]|nr:MAG: hypothetical protein KatS3mg009_1216 [Acidimicrobiia bacterium]